MKNKNFVFRVDSSKKIGSGHLMRTLTLAKGLREKGCICSFLSRSLDGNLNHSILSEGFALKELPSPDKNYTIANTNTKKNGHIEWLEVDWKNDARETKEILSDINPDWLVVDHYSISEDWEKAVLCKNFRIMVIDDLADRKHICDILLDQNLGSNDFLYKNLVPETCKKFFGPKYALLRPEFPENRSLSLKRRKEGKLKNILINFGGGNPDNFIQKTLQALLNVDLPKDASITVIFGGIDAINDEHRLLISKFKIKIKVFEMIKNMSEILIDTDLVIGAAGSSSWERCCLGIPSLVFSLGLNQNRIAKELSNVGAAIYLEEHDLQTYKLNLLFKDLMQDNKLRKISQNASSVCPGSGLNIIIDELIN